MTASIFRARARAALIGNLPWSMLITFIAGLMGMETVGRLNLISVRYDVGGEPVVGGLFSYLKDIIPPLDILVLFFLQWGLIIILINFIISLVLGGVAKVGLARYNILLLNHKEQQPLATLFEPFCYWGRAFALNFLTGLLVTLWTLLLVIPGIIAWYRYAMTPYILAENPDMGALDAIGASKRMMNGHKWRLFCLHLSFIGWVIVAAITFGFAWLWVSPYINMAQAAFYEDLKEKTY